MVGVDPGLEFGGMFWLALLIAAIVAFALLSRKKRNSREPVIPLVLTPEDGGFVVSSPLLPALNTQGDSEEEPIGNARDAFASVRTMYEQLGKDLPRALRGADPATVGFAVARRA